MSSKRPSRSAAKTASKKVKASAKVWGGANPESDDSDDYSDGGAEESSDDDESSVAPPPMTKSRGGKKKPLPPSQSDDDDESEDDEVIQRARKKQKLALDRVKKSKNEKGNKKKKFKDEKGKKARAKKQANGKRKKPPLPGESSSDERSSDKGIDEDRDPLEGSDLDKLMQEAMEGVTYECSSYHVLLEGRFGRSTHDQISDQPDRSRSICGDIHPSMVLVGYSSSEPSRRALFVDSFPSYRSYGALHVQKSGKFTCCGSNKRCFP
jgi:hypothetical protein